jgi:hypothetical protein
MATHFASVPPSVAALPFLFARPQPEDADWHYRSALAAAVAAERADDTRRNTRGRIAWLICEFGFQLARRRIDPSLPFPLDRQTMAEALGVGLCRVKRTLALLSLSGVVACKDGELTILDWRRLCSVATYDPVRLELKLDEDWLELPLAAEDEEESPRLTQAGDPACFV